MQEGPTTGEVPSALTRIFSRQRARARALPPAPWALRADRLRRLRSLVREQRAALAAAISEDFGHRSRHETELLEVNPLFDAIAHSLRHGPRWMRPRRRHPGFKFWPGAAWLLPQPLGVAGIVVPWNYPLLLSLGPAQCALAAGNRVLIKMSELTPRFGALLAQRVDPAFAPEELRVFNGDAEFSRHFCALPFDHLLFTGSVAVGRQVMRAASDSLTPVTLELGKEIFGPVLPVLEYASLDDAIAWINARPHPLALYLFARGRATVDRVLARTVSGGVTVNDTFLHAGTDGLPFGGVGESGMGAYHGVEGFRSFSHDKPVFLRARIGLLPWLYPPFGGLAERLLGMPRHEA